MQQPKIYNYTIPANGAVQLLASNRNIFLFEATGPITIKGDTFGAVEGVIAGQGLRNVPFGRLELFDETGSPNTIRILLAPDEFVNQIFSGSVQLVAASMDTLRTPLAATADFEEAVNTAAATARPIFLPAVNTGGVVLDSGYEIQISSTALIYGVLLAKSGAAPASLVDGEVVAMSSPISLTGGGFVAHLKLDVPKLIAAGKGLYMVTNIATSTRFAGYRWRAL